MSDKQKTRQQAKRGHHVSIAGDPADETLNDLVAQFSDPYAFVRELIQNSIDAGAQRIDIRMQYDEKMLVVEAVDDGEGMDKATIEGYLLTLFRSTKEDDLTKIGKFGIGFVSLFAMDPRQVIVDTGRDATWHRVIFDIDRNYTLLEMPDPFEGTTVRLEMERDAATAQRDCERIREGAVRWCGFAQADISTAASGIARGWGATSIARPFSVDSPVVVEHKEDGLHAVLGPSRSPTVGFYNQGLTLWEQEQAMIAGVSFRVMATHIEHTLTRDNVMRDRHFERVMGRLLALAQGALGDAVHTALATADLQRTRDIFASISHDHVWQWRKDAPLLPNVSGGRASLGDLQQAAPGWLRSLWTGNARSKRELLWATPGDELGLAVEAAGHLVLAASAPDDAHLLFAAELVGAEILDVYARYRAPRRPASDAEREARFACANTLARALDILFVLHPARCVGRAQLAVCQREPFSVEVIRGDGVREGEHLLVDIEHPLYRSLCALPREQMAPLLVRAALVAAGVQAGPVQRDLLAKIP